METCGPRPMGSNGLDSHRELCYKSSCVLGEGGARLCGLLLFLALKKYIISINIIIVVLLI